MEKAVQQRGKSWTSEWASVPKVRAECAVRRGRSGVVEKAVKQRDKHSDKPRRTRPFGNVFCLGFAPYGSRRLPLKITLQGFPRSADREPLGFAFSVRSARVSRKLMASVACWQPSRGRSWPQTSAGESSTRRRGVSSRAAPKRSATVGPRRRVPGRPRVDRRLTDGSHVPEQDERSRESTEQWREFHYDGLYPPQDYNRHHV